MSMSPKVKEPMKTPKKMMGAKEMITPNGKAKMSSPNKLSKATPGRMKEDKVHGSGTW